jgi:2-dehydro-3-deoxy-D-arabinonate dehydratase
MTLPPDPTLPDGPCLLRSNADLYLRDTGGPVRLGTASTLDVLLSLPLAELKRTLAAARKTAVDGELPLEAPISGQEVWAAGVTYRRSLDARIDEAVSSDPYDRVYSAQRPELFFKATPGRVRGPGAKVAIRADSEWNVPEPELTVVCNRSMEIVGWTIGNDMSSRSIEGENPLYLPQAKLYDGACAVGPAIALAWDFSPENRTIEMRIVRDSTVVFADKTSTAVMHRSVKDLIGYLGRSQSFPVGCLLLTGTGIVPPPDFSLRTGDLISITISGLGTLHNTVEETS